MRIALFPLAAAAALLLPHAASATEASTVRIETRPFYGATVTREYGVRVFRPLPPANKVIINPGGRTPLYLGMDEYRSESHTYNYNSNATRVDGGSDGVYGGTFAGGRDGHRASRVHSAPWTR